MRKHAAACAAACAAGIRTLWETCCPEAVSQTAYRPVFCSQREGKRPGGVASTLPVQTIGFGGAFPGVAGTHAHPRFQTSVRRCRGEGVVLRPAAGSHRSGKALWLLPALLAVLFSVFLSAPKVMASESTAAMQTISRRAPASDSLKELSLPAPESLDDYDTVAATASIADPLEPWNRFWFHFNDFIYLRIAAPLYRGYDAIMPDPVQSGLKNVLHNLLFPVRFINCLLQGKFRGAGVEFGRFLVNTTVGMGGLINVAKNKKTVVPMDSIGEDFGQTLGSWGIGHGIYIVWPFLGPSSLRESIGLCADTLGSPIWYLNYVTNVETSVGTSAMLRFNTLDDILPTYEELKKISVDPYIAMREAYIANRNHHVQQ